MPNQAETKNIKVGAYVPYLNATELGMIIGGLEFMDESKPFGVKADITGDAEVGFYNNPGSCKAKFKLVSHTPERIKAIFDALIYQNGDLTNDSRAGKQLKDYVFSFLIQQVLSDGTVYNNTNVSPESYQIFKGVVVNGYKIKSESAKAIELEIEIQGIPDLSKQGYPSYKKGSSVTLPAPKILYIDTQVGGEYTVKPTSITVTGVTGATFDSSINPDKTLNIFCTNYGVATVSDIETWKSLTFTGGTFVTPATARVRIG
jgi:hypothetical protein